MKVTRRHALAAGIGGAFSTLSLSSLHAEFEGPLSRAIEGGEEFWLATDAYIYGYPLVTMEVTRRVITKVPSVQGTRGPMGQFIKLRQYPDASFRDVTAPNADTLYTTAWIDVGKEPWVLSIPDMKDRYFLVPMLDGWTNVFQVPGKRTTGTGAQTYAITGPGWKGSLPPGVKEYKSPTSMVWILGRIYCTGTPEDYAAVHALQDQFTLVPLSSYGKPFTPPAGTVDPSIDMKTAVREQVNRMDPVSYFTLLAQLMKANPPAAADAPELAKLAKIGLVAGKDFDASKLDADFVKRVPQVAFDRIMLQFKVGKSIKNINGWMFDSEAGVYGMDYLNRAFITAIGARCKPRTRRCLSDVIEGCRRQGLRRRKQIRCPLPEGTTTASAGLLVHHDVRCELFLRRKPDQPLFDQCPAEPESQSGRLNRSLHPEPVAGRRQRKQLAARTQRQIYFDAAHVLAQRKVALHNQWELEAAGGQKGLTFRYRGYV